VNEAPGQAGTAPGASSAGTFAALTKSGAAETQDPDRADLNNELRVRAGLTGNTGGTTGGAPSDVRIVSARSIRLREVEAAANGSIDIAAGADQAGGLVTIVRRGAVTAPNCTSEPARSTWSPRMRAPARSA
jgi:hypothetical protein